MPVFRRLLQYSRPYWARIVVSLVASFGVAGTDGAIAYMVEPLLKKIFTEKDLTIFYFLPLGVILVFIFRGACRFCQEYYIRTAGQLAIQDIRNDIFKSNMALSLRFFTNNPVGVLMSRVLNDVGMMQEGVSSVITGVLKESFAAMGLLGVVFYRNWKLAIISLLVIPLTALPAQKIGRRIKNVSKETQVRVGIIASILQESFSGIKVIKAFRLEERSMQRFFAVNRECYHFLRKAIKYGSISTPIMELITSLGIAGVIWFGGHQVIRGEMTSTEFFSFIAAMIMLYAPIKKLLGSYNSVQQSMAAAERVFETMDERREIVDRPDARELAKAAGEVEFRQVSFRYLDDEVLRNISFRARRGEIIALVGQSGGGKSTLVSLIPRFYDVTAGAVLIDGIDIRDLKLDSLLRQIALVDQETILFNDSLANNIRYGKSDATDAEVEAAARAAYAHDFIAAMPEGYATNIGDRGVRLSGGQRQRICIARAILKDAPILILDEATSALDTESEQMVQEALNNLIANRTTFVIAHRLSTVLNADRILVLDQGEIVESGTHSELLQRDGVYRKLYDMQFTD
ncbi:MAG TPA: lipid A export permease/ATP-binding protein MsbA [Geobacteraceae bacterium]